MNVLMERKHGGFLWRLFFARWAEVAYLKLGLSGLCAEIEFPSDWHERRLGWVRLGFGLFRIGIAFPWPWVVPDEYQCSGPLYGFCFFGDGLHLHWGKDKGRRDDPSTVLAMPWQWRHRWHKILSDDEAHPYYYMLRSGEMQVRTATIRVEQRLWARPWLPWRRLDRYIDVRFDKEVGERSGSWKGGVVGCSYSMRPGELPIEALRRMELERRFE